MRPMASRNQDAALPDATRAIADDRGRCGFDCASTLVSKVLETFDRTGHQWSRGQHARVLAATAITLRLSPRSSRNGARLAKWR